MKLFLTGIFIIFWTNIFAQKIIMQQRKSNTLPLKNFHIYVDVHEDTLVKKAAMLLQQDIKAVTGYAPIITHEMTASQKKIIAIGTIKQSSFIQQLLVAHSINDSMLQKWEGYRIQNLPTSNGGNILMIAGSDRRGAAYGALELSAQMGVSPWYWWADVPITKKQLFINKSAVLSNAPKVKYRGIFINDEAPALSNWSKEKFGGFNHLFYEKVFELLLRLKANYLWPAMWGNAFNDDDSLNPVKAQEWGIVMGTSHHEPMLRSQQEWKRFGSGKWDYESNTATLQSFWKKGIENMGKHESIVTIGMRGDGDEPMTEKTATTLLEKIVKDQRKIISDVTGEPASQIPQLWALYKEVQDYYDKGMRVPNDVTLLLCDDNWGNIRRLPPPGSPERKGGYGIYYHFDYVGGPRNYKWLNTNPITKIWEQMHLAWKHEVNQIWIVNVGDIKPMEFPVSFFLDYAWDPDKIEVNDLKQYGIEWAEAQFSKKHAAEIANILDAYTKYNARRKPELLNEKTYSFNYNEWPTVAKDYKLLFKKANAIYKKLPKIYGNAYYQLVLHPVKACANLNEMYYYLALNKRAAAQNLLSANGYANKVKELYNKDSAITLEYHRLNGGKWNHMMSQTHIGYTYWQQPEKQQLPSLQYIDPAQALPEKDSSKTIFSQKALVPKTAKGNVFYEWGDKGISIEATHFTRKYNTNGIEWTIIPNLGRTGSAVTTFPVTTPAQSIHNAPTLEYDFYTYSKDSFSLYACFSPTLNYYHTKNGLQYAVAVDDETPQIISINNNDDGGIWNKWVAENIIIKSSRHFIARPGKHTLKYYALHAGVVLEKLFTDFGRLKPSYLGPPETKIK